jgi:RHS repeat-associated protein
VYASSSYVYGPDQLFIEQISSDGTVTYLHHDQQGSIRLLTGSTGTVTSSTTFDAYGKTGFTGSSTTPLGYDGQYTGVDTGLIYLRARVYEPATAQFLTSDPMAAITRAPYTYAGDNPLNVADHSGLGEGEIELPCVWPFCAPPPPVTEGAEGIVEGGREAVEGVAQGAESIWSTIKGGGENPHGGHREGDLPGKGEPGSTGVTEKGNGTGTIREYGPEGWAETDFDFGHNHPPGCPGNPHARDFEINPETGRLTCGSGRPFGPEE